MALAAAHIQKASWAGATGCAATAQSQIRRSPRSHWHDNFKSVWLVARLRPAITERTAQGFVLPSKASPCQGFVLLQGFALPSRSVPRKASSCHQGPAKYTSGQSHAHQSQSFYDRSPHYHRKCHDDGADAGDCDGDDGEAAVHIDRAHMRLAACDALYEAQAPTTPACKALTCCPARHCPAAPHPEHASSPRR